MNIDSSVTLYKTKLSLELGFSRKVKSTVFV